MYYLQHGMMVVIPLYLMRLGGVYNVEPLNDWSWSILAFAFNMGYHFWILQPLAFVSIHLIINKSINDRKK